MPTVAPLMPCLSPPLSPPVVTQSMGFRFLPSVVL